MAPVGPSIGAEQLGGSVYELDPGESTCPYHYEGVEEEWLLVLAGTPTLRDPEGEHELAAGDLVCFPPGPEGAHKVTNRSGAVARILMLSTMPGTSSASASTPTATRSRSGRPASACGWPTPSATGTASSDEPGRALGREGHARRNGLQRSPGGTNERGARMRGRAEDDDDVLTGRRAHAHVKPRRRRGAPGERFDVETMSRRGGR